MPDSYVTVMFSESFAELIMKGVIWQRASSETHDSHTFNMDLDVLDKRVTETPYPKAAPVFFDKPYIESSLREMSMELTLSHNHTQR